MTSNERALSTLVGQGWEVVDYSAMYDQASGSTDCFLLRRQKQHKILKIGKKWWSSGVTIKEIDV